MVRPWKPSVTVAAVVELDDRFLMVEEETPDGVRLNQPAGRRFPLDFVCTHATALAA